MSDVIVILLNAIVNKENCDLHGFLFNMFSI